jgi:hypothetical protein
MRCKDMEAKRSIMELAKEKLVNLALFDLAGAYGVENLSLDESGDAELDADPSSPGGAFLSPVG